MDQRKCDIFREKDANNDNVAIRSEAVKASANWSKNFGDFAVFSGPPKRIQFYVRYEAL